MDTVAKLKNYFCEMVSLPETRVDLREYFANRLIEFSPSRELCRIKASDKIHAHVTFFSAINF
jgi:hypothetical protein